MPGQALMLTTNLTGQLYRLHYYRMFPSIPLLQPSSSSSSSSKLVCAANANGSPQTLESDSFICVRQKISDEAQPEVIIVNLKNGNEVTRRPIKADSAIMHWHKQVIALKAQQRTLQIFDLGAKTKLKSTTMNEDVLFWKWVSIDTIGLVTDTSVYHWNVFDSTSQQPTKVFERNANLNVSSASLSEPGS